MKIGGGLMKASQKEWNSPDDPFSVRDYNKMPDFYNKKFMNYYGIPEESIDKRYLKEEYKQGIDHTEGMRPPPSENNGFDFSKRYKDEDVTFIEEFISGKANMDLSFSTGNYKLTFETGGILKTTRPIKYYLTSDEVQHIVNNDIGSGLFKVSTFGDMDFPNYGPYMFNGENNGTTGFLKIIDQSNPSLISGSATGYAGSADVPTTQILSFYNTGTLRNSVKFNASGLIENDVYDILLYSVRKDLQVNSIVPDLTLTSNAFSGAKDMVTGEFSWSSKENCISWPRYIELRKFVNNVNFLISGDPKGHVDDNYNSDYNMYVTGYEEISSPMQLHAYEFREKRPPLSLHCGEDDQYLPYNEQNYWYLGAPNYFTGSKYCSFHEITITGNSDIKSFYIDEKTEQSSLFCENIDLSENPNLGWFFTRDRLRFLKLKNLNLSGCCISGQNLSITDEFMNSTGIHSLPPGIRVHGDMLAIKAPEIQHVNLEGNNLNRTGILHWVNTCVMSCYSPNYSGQAASKVSGYLNIKNQTEPSATFAGFGQNDVDDLALSGIECLSGKGWIVDFDGTL